jgi:hypothetical protein
VATTFSMLAGKYVGATWLTRVGSGSSSTLVPLTRGLHSFPIQLNLSSSVHRMTQLRS